MPSWEPELYKRFETERTQPCIDLIARIPIEEPDRVIDLGCGPGNSTELLVKRYPHARIEALDSSAEMLASARKRVSHCRFIHKDVTAWLPDERYDLIFANAVLHWILTPVETMRRLCSYLKPGGVLAVQMPRATEQPVHRIIHELAHQSPWRELLQDVVGSQYVSPPGQDYDCLREGMSRVNVWETQYEHVLPSAEQVVEWIRGTGLRPYLEKLGAAERQEFLAEYSSRIAKAYPPRADGTVLLLYPRIFIIVER